MKNELNDKDAMLYCLHSHLKEPERAVEERRTDWMNALGEGALWMTMFQKIFMSADVKNPNSYGALSFREKKMLFAKLRSEVQKAHQVMRDTLIPQPNPGYRSSITMDMMADLIDILFGFMISGAEAEARSADRRRAGEDSD